MMDVKDGTSDIYRKILELIDSGVSFAVALVLRAEGSTPRKAGVRAVIDHSGRIWGTLGGGIVEAEAQRLAVESCRTRKPIIFDMRLQGYDKEDAEPICGGQMRILIDPTVEKDKAFYLKVAEVVRQRLKGVIVTTIKKVEQVQISSQWFTQDSIASDIAFPDIDEIRSCISSEEPGLFTKSSQSPDVFTEVFVEPLIPKPVLLIAGGGHIGRALALQGSLVGFDIIVVDDRNQFTNPELFPEGATTYCGGIPEQLAKMPVDKNTYIVIVTRGHKYDAEALEVCIHKPAAYVGMIGSRRKVALIRKNFIESGIATEEQFDRIFTPIGLDIAAITVPEIATSITAQLIAVRRKGIVHNPFRDKEPS